ncbi:bifunctional DNA primase/polymerase [Nitrosococcus wardiae]|uniref:Bifunctional DNA primase/polymerase n=1 Tax=Nitrosococcus wardiae TaxID=1814290 RepID=A0A4P7C1I0_9GAMM|nr:bifunctional DNA primase/polymerase [Nitrosococcus wardiae]QBQ56231.1 bifunctional DNA primase/polymerase [Nitrosococcus wardiae]
MDTKLSHAITYAQQGYRLLPVKPNSKVPFLKEWTKKATRDPAILEDYWRQYPQANIGLATGEDSGCFVLDVDVKKDAPGEQSLEELESEYGVLPETLKAKTPTGGFHYFFRHPGGRLGNRANFRPGLDIRGDGGYVLVAPSIVEGKAYGWLNEGTPLAEAPDWLLELLHEGPKPTVPGDGPRRGKASCAP